MSCIDRHARRGRHSILQQKTIRREASEKSPATSKLDQQAKALGLTPQHLACTISVNAKHKLGRLNAKTTTRILANPDTPPYCTICHSKNIWLIRSDVLASRAERLTRREQQSNRLRAVRY